MRIFKYFDFVIFVIHSIYLISHASSKISYKLIFNNKIRNKIFFFMY